MDACSRYRSRRAVWVVPSSFRLVTRLVPSWGACSPLTSPNGFGRPRGAIADTSRTRNRPSDDGFSVEWTMHDLRRAYASVATIIGTNSYHQKLLLNHALPTNDVTAGYIEMEAEDLRPSQQAVTDRLKKMGLPVEKPRGRAGERSERRSAVTVRSSREPGGSLPLQCCVRRGAMGAPRLSRSGAPLLQRRTEPGRRRVQKRALTRTS